MELLYYLPEYGAFSKKASNDNKSKTEFLICEIRDLVLYIKLTFIVCKETMYTVFSHSVSQFYKTNVFSKASVFYLLATLLTFIPPLLIAYRSQGKSGIPSLSYVQPSVCSVTGFWQKIDYYQEQPEIHFQHDLVILMETENPMRPIGWSTFKNYNQLLLDNVRVPMIKVGRKEKILQSNALLISIAKLLCSI